MYNHLLPQVADRVGMHPVLKKISIPELSITLDQSHFKTGTPYPNKNYFVGSAKQRKDGIGILIKTKENLDFFTTIYEWESPLTKRPIIHTVKNIIEPSDEDFDFVSQDIMLSIGVGDYKPRTHKDYKNMAPVNTQTTMYLLPDLRSEDEQENNEKRHSNEITINKINPFTMFVSDRIDTIKLHSIEPERLRASFFYSGDRYPHLEKALEF